MARGSKLAGTSGQGVILATYIEHPARSQTQRSATGW